MTKTEFDSEVLTISICMGSSCFSRGNNRSLEIIQQYIADNSLKARVELRGCLCMDKCKEGPNITIDGTTYHHVDPTTVPDILKHIIQGVRR
jgi:NADH:ubiquinone oxidoreductase subunit E